MDKFGSIIDMTSAVRAAETISSSEESSDSEDDTPLSSVLDKLHSTQEPSPDISLREFSDEEEDTPSVVNLLSRAISTVDDTAMVSKIVLVVFKDKRGLVPFTVSTTACKI